MERIDSEKYDLHGEELLIAAAVVGVYAMEADENGGSPQSDFQGIVEEVRGSEAIINAPVTKEIIETALGALDNILNGWIPESPMMVSMKTTLQSADINPDRAVQNMSIGMAAFLTDISQMAKERQ